jgi:hypothetical protein
LSSIEAIASTWRQAQRQTSIASACPSATHVNDEPDQEQVGDLDAGFGYHDVDLMGAALRLAKV